MGARTSRAVLITGCSSGIGAATARRLVRAGHTVYATARRVDTLAPLAALGCKVLPLDVTDDASMREAIRSLEQNEGAVGVLINNAGYAQPGAVESVAPELVRRQFETNVLGALRLSQLALPGMRRQGWGRIINVSSMGGKMTFPGFGIYHASKYALEALSDALRFETRRFGVRVVVIEPGFVRSEFGHAAIGSLSPVSTPDDVYAAFNRAIEKATGDSYEKGVWAKVAGDPDDVARVIETALLAERPRARYSVTASAKLLLLQRALLPDWAWDAFLRVQFPEPSPAIPRLPDSATPHAKSSNVAAGAQPGGES